MGNMLQVCILYIHWFLSEVACSWNSGTLDAIIKMIRYEGFYGFYKGMSTKIVQSVLAAAVLFMVKEELVKQTRFLLTKNAANSVKPKLLWLEATNLIRVLPRLIFNELYSIGNLAYSFKW